MQAALVAGGGDINIALAEGASGNSGTISGSTVNISQDNASGQARFSNSASGSIAASQLLNMRGGALDNAGALDSQHAMNLAYAQSVANRNTQDGSAQIIAQEKLNISPTASLYNDGWIQAESLELAEIAEIENAENGVVLTNADLAIKQAVVLNNAGIIQAGKKSDSGSD